MIRFIGLVVVFAMVSATAAPAFAKPHVGETLSNISKTRSEISQTFARNARG